MLQAFGKNIICKAIFEDKKNSLILSNKTLEPIFYEVISYGEETKFVSKGDKLYLIPYKLMDLKYEEEQFIFVDESSILARIID